MAGVWEDAEIRGDCYDPPVNSAGERISVHPETSVGSNARYMSAATWSISAMSMLNHRISALTWISVATAFTFRVRKSSPTLSVQPFLHASFSAIFP